jgi:hypothetical protein
LLLVRIRASVRLLLLKRSTKSIARPLIYSKGVGLRAIGSFRALTV